MAAAWRKVRRPCRLCYTEPAVDGMDVCTRCLEEAERERAAMASHAASRDRRAS